MNIEQARTEAGGWTPDLIARHAVSAHDTIRRLLAEVERLTRANKEAHQRREAETVRADTAQAALARVTGDDMTGILAAIPLTWRKTMSDGYPSTVFRSSEDVAADALAVIRIVAARNDQGPA